MIAPGASEWNCASSGGPLFLFYSERTPPPLDPSFCISKVGLDRIVRLLFKETKVRAEPGNRPSTVGKLRGRKEYLSGHN